MAYIAVGVGGVVGAVLRLLITEWFGHNLHGQYLLGTLFVNLTGCYMLGFLNGLVQVKGFPRWVVLSIGTGMIGAYTTFSTFSMEVIIMLHQGDLLRAAVYVMASSIGGVYLVRSGFVSGGSKKGDVKN
ncbi:fluoride efflux transporter CrcB [Peribacillus sp. SCS-155]|uniref:fluoride efflux transporter CrcB n=1 Tax=Peribacillus sedimenti TaxID=3115297 RepID=UPI00390657B0